MASAKKRLGRGLGNLITKGVGSKESEPEAKPKVAPSESKRVSKEPQPKAQSVEAIPEEAVISRVETNHGRELYREVSMSAIEPNPYQPRREFDPEHIKELADSIRSEGLLQPIVVRQIGKKYQLIAGERRWRAHQSLGLKSISVRLIEASDSSSAVISLIENLQREGLNPIEESLGFASLMSDFDLTQEGVAERVGKGRATIANSLRLLQLEREIQAFLTKGLLSTGHAKVLLGIEDSTQRMVIARRIIEAGWSVRETERQVRRIKNESVGGGSGRSQSETESTVIKDLEKQLSSRLNANVQIKHTAKKGKVIIEYFGNEDLQRILEATGLQ